MKLEKILENRRSVREYKDKKIQREIIEDLFEDMKNKRKLQKNIDLELIFIEAGEEAFKKLDGIVGYYGKVIRSPHYIAIASPKEEGYLENGGYLGEKLVLKATELGLGTCWIEVPENDNKVKEVLNIQSENILIGLLAIGYPQKEAKVLGGYSGSKRDSISPLTELGYPKINFEYSSQPVSGRISIEDMVFVKEWGKKASVDELENRGIAEPLYYMRLAPSWGNRQPWKFILDGEKIVLTVRNDSTSINEKVAKIEAGIAMLYFELIMHEKGIPGGWTLGKLQEDYGIPENYFIAGYYSI